MRGERATVTIRRVYNNNVVLGADPDGTEVVLLGKGLGFQRKPGDRVDPAGAQRFVAQGPYKAAAVATLLSDATLEEATTARDIVALAHERLRVPVSQGFLLPVLDHLSFAVRRAREGVRVDIPLRWEVAQLYPREAEVGREAVALAGDRLRVRLQEDEWVAFALHFINQQWVGGDLSKTVAMTDAITGTFALLEELWGRPLDQTSVSSARFVTHLRYLFVRAIEGRQLVGAGIDVMGAVQSVYPEAAEAARRVAQLIDASVKGSLTSEEVAYLALHTGRLYAEVHYPG